MTFVLFVLAVATSIAWFFCEIINAPREEDFIAERNAKAEAILRNREYARHWPLPARTVPVVRV